jgi:hypothetical protein
MVYLNIMSLDNMTSKQAILLGFNKGVQNRGILDIFPLGVQTLLEWTPNQRSHASSHLSPCKSFRHISFSQVHTRLSLFTN